MMTEISYSGYRFPPEISQPAIWLWWLFAYFVVITIGKLLSLPHPRVAGFENRAGAHGLDDNGPLA